ncbi:MAG TPA: methylmalonyl Co-A mutase-associated GTPase MeaB [Rhizomicrobium sp.]|nr:methylmalonyl Co-A mutase-associated GTPase MeaB [Rhizomicrobium sp.]
MTERKVKDGLESLLGGDRRALARAITLVESTRAADREKAESLLSKVLPHAGKAIRLGISGAPGAGKSTFIETFGTYLTGEGHKVAVLAVDPSSRRSGGSILGDKTRMEKLARDPNAFIRPSPAGTTLGGVARRTREAMLLVEAAGFDVVIVETVGVGQSETAVSEMVDIFLLLLSPGGGDDLQGIKRGVMELADIVLVTKADGDLKAAAARAAADYRNALHLMRAKYPGLSPEVIQVSALEGSGIGKTWSIARDLHGKLEKRGFLARIREEQARRWFWNELQSVLTEEILSSEKLGREARKLEAAAVAGEVLPYSAARALFRHIIAA